MRGMDGANRPQSGANHPESEKSRDSRRREPKDAGVAGYETIARRPRVQGFDEPVSPERADRIEGMFRDIDLMPSD